MNRKGILLIFLTLGLIFASSVRAAWSAAAFLPQYNLNVSFDVEASKIFGRAEIHAKAGSELTIHTDDLKIIEATVEGKKTDFNGISLIVSKNFVVSKDTYNGIEIAAYLLPEDAHFAKTFIEHTKRYLKTYEKLLGKYPFKRLSIVEHFEKAGYSMPSYIFLGKDDFKLPIEKSPLGHEIVHQWFGNYVYTDYDRGNWNEGLTIYFADHSYDDIKGFTKDSGILLCLDIKKNPLNPEKGVAIVDVAKRQDTSSALERIFNIPFTAVI